MMLINEEIRNVHFVDLAAQHLSIKEEIAEAIAHVLERTAYILGPETREFEESFAVYCDAQHAIGVSSGTSALEIVLRAYGIGPGDEVITVANTFIATALAISCTGARPVLVDIDPLTYNIDTNQIEQAISKQTRAIIPVHLYGQPADMDPILALAERHNLIVIEDAAQAHGAKYKGRPAGSMGHAAAFSFYPAKNLGAFGDAGMIVTNDERVADFSRMFRDVGQSQKYHHDIKGYNHRMDNLQAAILGVELRHLDQWNEARQRHAALYQQLLASNGVQTPEVMDFAEPVWHLYVVQVDDRDGLRTHLQAVNVGSGIHYPIPIHLQLAYKDLGYKKGDFPITEQIADRIVSLPMHPNLTPGMIDYVAQSTRAYYR